VEKGVTQEKLAEYLNVSHQAVSRWENGTAYPDITLVPVLANFFWVTTDELLAYPSNKNHKIKAIVDSAEKMIEQGVFDEPIKILREALTKYQCNDRLQCALMYALYAASEDGGMSEEDEQEFIMKAHHIRQFSTDDYCRNESIRLLFRHYCDTNRKSEARFLLDSMPTDECTREANEYWLTSGEERVEYLKKRVSTSLRDLSWAIWAYACHANISAEEKAELKVLRGDIEERVKTKFEVESYAHAVDSL